MACFCAAHSNASLPIFQSLFDNHCQVLFSSVFSGISLTNSPCISFFTPVLFKFSCFLFFKFPTIYSIFSIDCLSCSNSPHEIFFRIDNIKTQNIFLFSNTTFHTHQTSTSLFMYNLSTSLCGRIAPYIVIVFLDILSISFNSLSFHCSIPVLYLNAVTSCSHFFLFDLIQFNYAQICMSFLFDLLHFFTI